MNYVKKISPSHILGIDAIRFFAALLVVWFHFGFLMGRHTTGTAAAASRHLLAFPELYDWSFFGWVGVEIFFVISGFVIAYSAEKATAFSFFTSRFVRLAPGVWICSSITLVTILAFGVYDPTMLFRSYRHSMAFVPWRPWIDGAFWTLIIEIAFYFCVFLLIVTRQIRAIRAFAIFLGLWSSAFLFARAVFQASLTPGAVIEPFLSKYGDYTDLSLLHHGVYFALGVLLWVHLVKSPKKTNVLWMTLFGAAGCLEVAVQASGGNIMQSDRMTFTVCAVWCSGVVGIIQSVRLNSKLHRLPQRFLQALKSAGLMTFPLYLVHTIAGATIMGQLVMLGWSRWAALATGLSIVLLLAFVVSTHLEPALQRAVKSLLYHAHDGWRAVCQVISGNA